MEKKVKKEKNAPLPGHPASFPGKTGLWGLVLGMTGLGSAVLLLAVSGWFITAAGVAGLSLATLHAFNYLQPAALIRLLAIVRTLALYGERLVSHDGVLRLLARLRLWLFRALSRTDRFRMARMGGGELMQRMLADIDLLDQWPLRGLAPWVWALVLGSLFCVALLLLSPSLALIFSVALAAIWIAQPLLLVVPARRLARTQTEKGGVHRQFLLETLAGLLTLRTTGGFSARLETFFARDDAILKGQWRLQCLGLFSQFFILAALSAGLWRMLLYAGPAVREGRFSGVLFAGIVCALLGLMEVMTPLSQTFQALGFTLGARDRLREAAGKEVEKGGILTPGKGPCLCLSRVRARREGAIAGPEAVSFCLKKGDSMWIQGPSGCGKSTLAAVMGGWLRPDAGEARVNGMPVEALEERCLRRHVGLLEQEIHLFPLSLRENLRLARPGTGDAVLWGLLADVGLRSWAESLPQGLDTVLGAYGAGVSGGQARRLALARLLLMETPILILDEPFEGLDSGSAASLLALLRRRQAGGILVLISHQSPDGDFTHHYRF